ncbi:hypothetical protein [Cupriavidus numazuensis]|uniref:Uncharacterized protein n=1 Tax=Cupriavidus numazuensis TaxID=221992 RepID=A0ABM8TA09_9BURK|nr:hypothetical protein [Cupriavidus numazuensis]CAG2129349.1 hypothetical protein LMG26411_00159 [Cupriavidus numazuensis]
MVREVLRGEQPIAIATAAAGNADVASAIDAAMNELARELGCAFSDLIPHNSGLFIPGQAKACANPIDAIRQLFAHVYAGGRVLRAPRLMPDAPAQRTSKADPSPIESDPRQVALFEV